MAFFSLFKEAIFSGRFWGFILAKKRRKNDYLNLNVKGQVQEFVIVRRLKEGTISAINRIELRGLSTHGEIMAPLG
jgi:hypothetical protein